MKTEHRHLTDDEKADQRRDGRVLMPGVWIDRDHDLHFSLPDILAAFQLDDTRENRRVVAETIKNAVAQAFPSFPDIRIVEQD